MLSRSPSSFVLVLVSCMAMAACAHRPAVFNLKSLAGKDVPSEVPLALQQMAALHEAAHAVAIVGYFGRGTVKRVTLRTSCCSGNAPDYVGLTEPDFSIRRRMADDYRKLMVMMYAGCAAEREFYGDGIANDRQMDHANVRTLANTLVHELRRKKMEESDAEAFAERMMRDAREEARRFVRMNAGVIRKVAGATLMQPEKNGALVLKGRAFDAVVKNERILVPGPGAE